MNNKVFYQHPNLMRVLGMHETVMEVMVNVLGGGKSQVLLCVQLNCSATVYILAKKYLLCCIITFIKRSKSTQ